jgi:cytochrome c oxidase subunit 2
MIMRTRIAITAIMAFSVCSMTCSSAFSDDAKVVKISAKRFEFSPKNITLKKGVPVILSLTSEDRSHGFSIPAMNVRADIAPGKVTELKVTPQKAGELDFYCDVFCGNGHEDMNGKITVTD